MDETMNNAVENATEEVIERVYDIDGKLLYMVLGGTVILIGGVWIERKFGFARRGIKKLVSKIFGGRKVKVAQSEAEAEAVVNGEKDIEELD